MSWTASCSVGPLMYVVFKCKRKTRGTMAPRAFRKSSQSVVSAAAPLAKSCLSQFSGTLSVAVWFVVNDIDGVPARSRLGLINARGCGSRRCSLDVGETAVFFSACRFCVAGRCGNSDRRTATFFGGGGRRARWCRALRCSMRIVETTIVSFRTS